MYIIIIAEAGIYHATVYRCVGMGYEITEYHKLSYMYIEEWGGRDLQLHFHSDIELSLIVSGDAAFIINKHKYKLEAGDVILVNRCIAHSIEQNRNCRAIWLGVNPLFCSSYYPDLLKIRFREWLFDKSHPLNGLLVSDIKQLLEISKSEPEAYEFKMQEILNHIFYVLLTQTDYVCLPDEVMNLEAERMERVRRIIDYMEGNFDQQPRLEELAEEIQLSPDYLSHFIKEALGITFRDYVTMLRLHKAVELMENKSVSQLDMLLQTGFTDYRYFSRAFRKVYGVDPEDYYKDLPQQEKI